MGEGVFGVHRGVWDHPLLVSNEPYSKLEAWLWLVSEATWKPRKLKVGKSVIELGRGQVGHSLRHLAGQWKWTVDRVRYFLDEFAAATMITKDSTTGRNIITICNYDRYQIVGLPDTTDSTIGYPTLTPQLHHKEEEGKKERTVSKIDHGGDDTRASLARSEALKLAEELATIAGHSDPQAWPAGWCGAPLRVEAMLEHGWKPEVMLAAARGVMAKKRDGPPASIAYFERPFAKAHAEQNSPLPIVEIREQAKVNGAFQVYSGGGREPRRGSRDDTRERLVRALDNLDDFARSDGQADGGQIGSEALGRLPKPQCS